MRPEPRLRRWLAVLATAALWSAAPAAAQPRTSAAAAPELFYHIFVRSFADSNGDRQGDLRGIRDRLGYLQSLGVTTIMLTPLYPSRFYHNYFADDFAGIDPELGTMEDFTALVGAVHARGMRIILDQEIQYVTGHHAWRRQSADDPQSPFGGYLLHRDARRRVPAATLLGTNDVRVWPGLDEQIYTVDLGEPQVRAYFARFLTSWIDPNGDGDTSDGVDGFRIDHMMDDLDNAGLLTGLLSDFWAPLIAQIRARKPDVRFIAEQADWGDGAAFLARGGVDMVFAFPLWQAASELDAAKFAAAVERSNAVVGPGHSQLVFVENHDTSRFAHGAPHRPARLRLGAAVTMLTGWIPSLYYGQEIGLSGQRTDEAAALPAGSAMVDLRDIPLRQAFRWKPDPLAAGNAAWYRSDPRAYRTPDSNVPGDGASLEEQDHRRGSLLNLYRDLARLRRRYPVLAGGATRVVAQQGDLVLLARRSGSASGSERWSAPEEALVLYNFGAAPQAAELPLSPGWVRRYGTARLRRIGPATRVVAPAYSATVWTLGR